jgi:hypothetical protein
VCHRIVHAEHLSMCEVLSHSTSHQSECRNAMPGAGPESPTERRDSRPAVRERLSLAPVLLFRAPPPRVGRQLRSSDRRATIDGSERLGMGYPGLPS